jgi:hypothetical protein
VVGFIIEFGTVAHVLIIAAAILTSGAYELVMQAIRIHTPWVGVNQPLAVLTDVILLHYSMYKYEFSTVDWRGRNICIPVMHVIPRLPNKK